MPVHKRRAAPASQPHATKASKRPRSVSPPASPVDSLSDCDADGSCSRSELSTSSDTFHHSDGSLPPLVTRSHAASPATAAAATVPASTAADAYFDPDECQPTRWPIFRLQHVVARPPAADKTEAELAELTFVQWLDYYLAHKSFEVQRKFLLSDEHYCLLLDYVTSNIDGVAEFGRQRQLSPEDQQFLYHHVNDNTFQYSMAEYRGALVAELDKGLVLVTFKEPARKKGGKLKRRRADSSTAMTHGLHRVCVPFSYIDRVLHHCHTGPLGSTMHTGQLSTWGKVSAAYHGINRTIVRMYVKKCAVCQQHQTRAHKAALVPITARTLFERVVIDLVDYERKPSHGYHYILHAVDHFSKFHWAWAMQDKRPATVAYHINCLLADTGPIKHVQCDNGMEFVAEVLVALADFSCGGMLNSSSYHPQTNGLVERGNSLIKKAVNQWIIQEGSEDWYPVLARIRHQINCDTPRTTRYTPYELVYGKKAPDWPGLNITWPLHADTLDRVLNDAPAPADAVAILSSMASGNTGSATPPPSPPPPASTTAQPLPPSASSQLPPTESQLPLPESQLPAAETEIYPNVVYDLAPGVAGPVNKCMADTLNVGCHFVRLGGEGAGRCALSAFYTALNPMETLSLGGAQRRRRYDNKRKELRAMWEALNTDQTPSSRKKRKYLHDMVADVWFSGNEPTSAALSLKDRHEGAWQQFGADLQHANTSLGTEAIAVLAYQHGVNVLLFVSHSQVHDFGAGTTQSTERWQSANAEQLRDQLLLRKGKPGGAKSRWLQVESGTDNFIVPNYITQDAPWVVLYQRTTAEWKVRVSSGGEPITETIPATGHFEAVVKQTTTHGVTEYHGVYRMGDDTANEYDQVLRVAHRQLAYQNSQAASQRMAADYDAKAKPHAYRHLDAVGARIPGKNPRKGHLHNCLPCLVVDVREERRRAGTRVVVHRMYTVWCPFGVLSNKLKVDKLVSLSINNFPALLHLRDERLSARQRLACSDPNWQSPLATLAGEPRITLKTAWQQHRAVYKKRTEDQSRHRKVPSRTAADAASTSIAAGMAGTRAALSLHTVTNQPAPLSSSGARSPSRIVRILHANKKQYKVLWSQPVGSPAVTYENRSSLDKQAEDIEVVLAWRREQLQQQPPQQSVEQQENGGADTRTDSDAEADEADELCGVEDSTIELSD